VSKKEQKAKKFSENPNFPQWKFLLVEKKWKKKKRSGKEKFNLLDFFACGIRLIRMTMTPSSFVFIILLGYTSIVQVLIENFHLFFILSRSLKKILKRTFSVLV
jgi:hypothetical protein